MSADCLSLRLYPQSCICLRYVALHGFNRRHGVKGRVRILPWTWAAMSSAAPQMPAGRRPVWIQSRFMDLMSCSAVALTRCIRFRKSSRAAKRCTYRLGSIGLRRGGVHHADTCAQAKCLQLAQGAGAQVFLGVQRVAARNKSTRQVRIFLSKDTFKKLPNRVWDVIMSDAWRQG